MKSLASSDRRVFGRRHIDIAASVRIGYRIIPCIIKDISEGGALLEFSEEIDLPPRLLLSWPEQKAEITCEVRHVRRHSAGVQFTRPQMLTLRAAMQPSHQVAQPAPVAEKDSSTDISKRGSHLVAELRRGIRQIAAAASPGDSSPAAVRSQVLTPASVPPPRDFSTVLASLKTAAAAIVEARQARAVPRPLSARIYVGAVITAPALAPPQGVPMPAPARVYAGAIAQAVDIAAMPIANIPGPLPASAWAAVAGASVVPRPMAAALYRATCQGHPCAFAVWRSLATSPPRPLSAAAYAELPDRPVA